MAQKSIRKSLALTSRTDFFLLFRHTMTTDQDIGRFTMSMIMHREVEGLFRWATKRGWSVVRWMPQRKFFVVTEILVFGFDLFMDGRWYPLW